MKPTRNTVVGWGAALALLLSGAGGASTDRPEELRFRVMLDDQKIGYHRFRIQDDGSARVIDIDADFDVRVLLVPVYSYRHVTTEVWREGCLKSIRAETDANGERYTVRGERRAEAFALSTGDGTRRVEDACLMTFAYWNRDFLAQRRLLNAQTGEVIDVEVVPLGQTLLALGTGKVPAEGYRVLAQADGVDIRVWYALADGRWLALESVLESGRTLRYEPVFGDRLADSGAGA